MFVSVRFFRPGRERNAFSLIIAAQTHVFCMCWQAGRRAGEERWRARRAYTLGACLRDLLTLGARVLDMQRAFCALVGKHVGARAERTRLAHVVGTVTLAPRVPHMQRRSGTACLLS